MTTKELFAGNLTVNIEQMRGRMKAAADAAGLPFHPHGMVFNSRLAQELGFWADSQQKGDAFHKAVFEACFVHGKNIGDVEVLVDLARSAGLAEADTREVLISRAYGPAVDLDWSMARNYGITMVPAFVMNRHGLFGMQTFESLEKFVVSQGAQKRVNR